MYKALKQNILIEYNFLTTKHDYVKEKEISYTLQKQVTGDLDDRCQHKIQLTNSKEEVPVLLRQNYGNEFPRISNQVELKTDVPTQTYMTEKTVHRHRDLSENNCPLKVRANNCPLELEGELGVVPRTDVRCRSRSTTDLKKRQEGYLHLLDLRRRTHLILGSSDIEVG